MKVPYCNISVRFWDETGKSMMADVKVKEDDSRGAIGVQMGINNALKKLYDEGIIDGFDCGIYYDKHEIGGDEDVDDKKAQENHS